MPLRSPQLWEESLRASRGTPAIAREIPEASKQTSVLPPRPMSYSYSEVSCLTSYLPPVYYINYFV